MQSLVSIATSQGVSSTIPTTIPIAIVTIADIIRNTLIPTSIRRAREGPWPPPLVSTGISGKDQPRRIW